MHPGQFERLKAASRDTESFGPLLVPAEDAFRALGIKRTLGFALIRDGRLLARKIGTRTVVEAESLRRFASGLPRAGRGA